MVSVKQGGICNIFWVFGMTGSGIEPWYVISLKKKKKKKKKKVFKSFQIILGYFMPRG